MNKPVAVVLGGTHPHRSLLQNLRNRGYHTVLVDYYENPCAKECADEHLRESTLDRSKVLQIVRERHAVLIMSACVDQANVIACSVAEELGLPHPYNCDTARTVTNKVLMKRFMSDHGVPTSRFARATTHAPGVDSGLTYPLIVKPVDSNSSKGVRRVDRPSDLPHLLDQAIAASRSEEAIIEEFVDGVEVGVDCFVGNDDATVLITKERRKIPPSLTEAQQIYGCFWPAAIPPEINSELAHIASRIARGLGLRNCPLMLQLILNRHGISVIEFAARFGGGESVKVIELATGVDIIDLSVASFLGETRQVTPAVSDRLYADTFLYARQGIFGAIRGGPELLRGDQVEAFHVYKTVGMTIAEELSSNNRVGSFIVSGRDRHQLRERIDKALAMIDITDSAGNSIFLREIY